MWDSPALKNAFVEHGFQQVRICEYGDWPDSRFAEVEHPESFIDAFGVEGVKQ
ncbi:hypothetical protein PN462_05745 [Spirulina sp. CS-785/01]|uniref:hypothetical protein n=1 Tax=Spirulina sp. CS-785/01 TaxID=3021716 RepID=UPI00232CE5BD|nr:hypothetical protein [Spirulina sp. CS-785/01]MDB9312599.1 hypothetical protein [Spirulina sp. CS-785/01]